MIFSVKFAQSRIGLKFCHNTQHMRLYQYTKFHQNWTKNEDGHKYKQTYGAVSVGHHLAVVTT